MAGTVAPFPRVLAPLCLAITAVAVALGVWSVATQGPPPIGSLLVFGTLAIFAINRVLIAPSYNGVSFSPLTLVLMAAVVVFDHDQALAGVVLVGLVSDIHLPTLRRRTWPWVVFNGGMWACSAAGAALVYCAQSPSGASTSPSMSRNRLYSALSSVASA